MRRLPSLSIVNVTLDSGDLICDNSTGSLRPLVPEVLRKPLFLALHNVSHPGVRGSRRLVCIHEQKVYDPGTLSQAWRIHTWANQSSNHADDRGVEPDEDDLRAPPNCC